MVAALRACLVNLKGLSLAIIPLVLYGTRKVHGQEMTSTQHQQGCGDPAAWNYEPNATVANNSLCFVPPCATSRECGDYSRCVPDFMAVSITPQNMGTLRFLLLDHDANGDMHLSARERFMACTELSDECEQVMDACQSLYGTFPPEDSPCNFCTTCDVHDTYTCVCAPGFVGEACGE
jgi:hypothetical protein